VKLSTQSASSIVRQILGYLGIIFGVLTQSVTAMHLPVAISSVIAIGGAVIIAIEHYVSDPSTGTPPTPPPTA
jgi:tetrahydromethanopterin S-methyltransferase subunit C